MGTWLEDYLAYTQTQESPERFHMWCGLGLIAATLNRRVWLPCISSDGAERYKCFPGQVNIVLVAGSGKAKKSTAIADIAEEILKESTIATIYDGTITPERLLAKLGSQPSGKAIMTIIEHELTTFLSKRTYQEHMVDILTKLIDCKEEPYETQTKTYHLKDICVTLILGTTPRNLGSGVPSSAHDTGFMGRFLWIFGERSGKVESLTGGDIDPIIATRSLTLRSSLVVGLRNFSKLTGPFTYSKSAKAWFDDWYRRYYFSEDSEGEGYPQRKPDHLRRVAMLLNVSRYDASLEYSVADFEMGLGLLTQIEKDFSRCFTYIGRHASAEAQQRIIDVFRRRNGAPVTSQEIYSRCLKYFGDPRTLESAMRGLVSAGIIANGGKDVWHLSRESD